MNKTELAMAIEDISGNPIVPDNHTKAELEAMLAAVTDGSDEPTPDVPSGPAGPVEEFPEGVFEIQRRKMNRGSTRRIHRATENVVKALSDFSKEIDQQVFAVDSNGRRSGEHPLIAVLRRVKDHIKSSVSSFT